jgi:serine/threonine protein kinase
VAALVQGNDTSDWLLDYSEILLIRAIGEGAFGKVFLGRWHETDVAVKLLGSLTALGLASSALDGDAAAAVMKTLDREVGLMKSMRHPNTVLFMGLCLDPPAVVTGDFIFDVDLHWIGLDGHVTEADC